LDLRGEVHSIWVMWASNLKECKGTHFFLKFGEVGRTTNFDRDAKVLKLSRVLPWSLSASPWKLIGGGLTSPIYVYHHPFQIFDTTNLVSLIDWNYAMLSLFTLYFMLYQQMSNWLFGHYRTSTTLLDKKLH
jgi:hypothetical protein